MIANDRGLTLVEILVALAIVSVGLLGLAAVVPVSSSAVQDGSQLSTATFLAEQAIERARAAPWTVVPAVDCLGVSVGDVAPASPPAACPGMNAPRLPDEARVPGSPAYRRVVRVTDCGVTPCAGVTDTALRLVTVAVTYRALTAEGRSAVDKVVTLEWLVARK